MTLRRVIALLTIGMLAVAANEALAQSAFPAPLPGQGPFPPVNYAPPSSLGRAVVPPMSNAQLSPFESGRFPEPCMAEFAPLRADAEQRGKLIKAASERHASPVEACELLGNFSQTETKMIRFVEANSARCGIPAQVAEHLKAGHNNTENLQKKVCMVAQQMQPFQPRGQAPALPVGDFDPPTSIR